MKKWLRSLLSCAFVFGCSISYFSVCANAATISSGVDGSLTNYWRRVECPRPVAGTSGILTTPTSYPYDSMHGVQDRVLPMLETGSYVDSRTYNFFSRNCVGSTLTYRASHATNSSGIVTDTTRFYSILNFDMVVPNVYFNGPTGTSVSYSTADSYAILQFPALTARNYFSVAATEDGNIGYVRFTPDKTYFFSFLLQETNGTNAKTLHVENFRLGSLNRSNGGLTEFSSVEYHIYADHGKLFQIYGYFTPDSDISSYYLAAQFSAFNTAATSRIVSFNVREVPFNSDPIVSELELNNQHLSDINQSINNQYDVNETDTNELGGLADLTPDENVSALEIADTVSTGLFAIFEGNYNDTSLTFPAFHIDVGGQSYTVWDSYSYDFNSLNEHFSGLLAVVRFATVGLCYFALIRYLHKTYEDIFMKETGG